jgi:hypothetical protein
MNEDWCWFTWMPWHCPQCGFEVPDDGTVQATQQMGAHIEEHEREEEASR